MAQSMDKYNASGFYVNTVPLMAINSGCSTIRGDLCKAARHDTRYGD